MNSSKQIKIGALISYFTIAFNIVAGLIYTPWMISQIGQSNYGLYTLATSLITMFLVDFGMSAAVTRFVSKYKAAGEQEKINNFLGIVYKLYLAIDIVIMTALVIVYFFIESLYTQLSPSEIEIFKVLYIIVGLFSIISFPFTNLNGILTSYELFVPLKLCDLFNKGFVIFAVVVSLLLGYGIYALVLVNAIAGLLTIGIKLIIIKRKTETKVNFRFFDKSMLKEIFGFSMYTTISSLAQRLIFNITPSIIAVISITGSVGVAVFGLASTIEGYVYMVATAINGMFMARISKMIHDGKKEEQLLPLMIRIGRIQCMIIGLLIVGFVSLGESFIVDIWNKPDFSDSYLCSVFLIIPSFFYLPMEIAHTTLVVENKVKLQAYVFVIMGVLNVCCSFVLSKYFGALGASVSIFIAYMVRTVLMALIYDKVLHIDMKTFSKETFLKLSPYLIVTVIVGLLAEKYNPLPSGFIRFGINGVIVVVTFGVLMLAFGMNQYEKNLVFGIFKRAKKLVLKNKS